MKAQIRRDSLLGRVSIIAEGRNKRPHEDSRVVVREKKICFFCPGNEALTPPTISRFPSSGQWQIRVFRNKFPALEPPLGDHEIIVETEHHEKSLEDLSTDRIVHVFQMWKERAEVLSQKYKHVSIFKNFGPEAGASLHHSHSQIIASNFTPPLLGLEASSSQKYHHREGSCPWCDKLKLADLEGRVGLTDSRAVSITPEAPRFPYEVWIVPKKHIPTLSNLKNPDLRSMASLLKKILLRLKALGSVSYNMVLHSAPPGAEEYMHFHIEILPRIGKHAAYELGEGVYIVSVSPEEAADFYQG